MQRSLSYRVDQLYAFFLQWSPSLYDNDEELDVDGQGFVVVEHENIDIVDNHFQPTHRLSQSWKVSAVPRTVSVSRGRTVPSLGTVSVSRGRSVPSHAPPQSVVEGQCRPMHRLKSVVEGQCRPAHRLSQS